MDIGRLTGLVRIQQNPNRGGLNEQWSAVVSIGGYSKIVYGVPFVLRALRLLFGGFFVCACLVVLGYVLSLI